MFFYPLTHIPTVSLLLLTYHEFQSISQWNNKSMAASIYLGKRRLLPAFQRQVPHRDRRADLRAGAMVVVGPLLTGRGEGVVEGQRAVGGRGGDGMVGRGHQGGVLRDVAHGLGAGQGRVVAGCWRNTQGHGLQ